MALRIRAPEEYQDVSVSNNFRPAPLDGSGISGAINNVRREISGVAEIVEQAHDNAMRSQALADSVQYETRLTALRAEMDNEEPPEGVDLAEWARAYPQRWEQRSARLRQEVVRARGARSQRYHNYFNERALQISGREQGAAIERSQARIVDIDRGAGMEHLAILSENARDPDIPETSDDPNAPSRQRYEQEYVQVARELARRGTWSSSFASERIIQLQEERRTFLETEDRHQRTRTAVDEVRAEFPDDPDLQMNALRERFPNAQEREMAMDYWAADLTRDNAAQEAEFRQARSRVEQLINQHQGAWRRYATPADIARMESNQGAMAQIRQQIESLTNPGGEDTVRRSIVSARNRVFFESLSRSSDPEMGRAFVSLNLDIPLNEEQAMVLRDSGFADVQEGDVLADVLTTEDYRAVTQMQRERRTGVMPNGDFRTDATIDALVNSAVAQGLADFSAESDAATARTARAQFRSYVGAIVRDIYEAGGYRPISPQESQAIILEALSRADTRTPRYRRPNVRGQTTYADIPVDTAFRIRRSLSMSDILGRSPEEVDQMVVDRYVREHRDRVNAND